MLCVGWSEAACALDYPFVCVVLRSHDDYSRTCVERQSQEAMLRELNPLLHSQLRLAVMSILMNCEQASFVYIKKQTQATAGNLSVQLDKLQAAGYISVDKSFEGKKPLTTCSVTEKGRLAFEEYVNALRDYLEMK